MISPSRLRTMSPTPIANKTDAARARGMMRRLMLLAIPNSRVPAPAVSRARSSSNSRWQALASHHMIQHL